MNHSLFQLIFVILITTPFIESKIRTLKNFRSLKNSNINRLHQARRLSTNDYGNNPLLFSPEEPEEGPSNHGNHFMMLSFEISKREADIRSLGKSVDSVQNKVDDLSESVVERINEVYNLVNNQLLGVDGI